MKAYWHIHHEELLEFSDNIQERIDYIKTSKPPHEIEVRLRLLKPVQGALPAAYYQARSALDQARSALDQARSAYNQARLDQAWSAYNQARLDQARSAYYQEWSAYDQAQSALDQAWSAYCAEIEALHKIECPNCPWNGHTIFPGA